MARKFVIGVELLTGLVIGAAAAAVAVSFIIVFLVNADNSSESGLRATEVAYALNLVYSSTGDPDSFTSVVSPLLQSGSMKAVAVIDEHGNLLHGAGPALADIPVPGETRGWYFSQIPGEDYSVGVFPSKPSMFYVYRGLLIGFAALTLALSILAVLTPRYLARSVITPLREILVEADRFILGGGSSAEAAGASFHRLVELLHQRERQLNELKEAAEQRADIIEERSAAILSVLGSAVFALDSRGNLTLHNRQSIELFDLSSDDTGQQFPWNRTAAGKALKSVLRHPGRSGVAATEFQLQESPAQSARMYGVSLSTSGRDETAVMVTDVTRISELERSIADQAAMADMGAASAGISHEMGNTLCALSGFVDLLARGHTDARTQNILSEFRQEVVSARQLIDSFGIFARSPKLHTSILNRDDVLSICSGACDDYDLKCSMTINDDDFFVNADRKLLYSCVRNLIRNAVEAASEIGIEVSISVEGRNLSISILDTGSGLLMNSEEIFRPFRTTKNRSGGNMGLGLPVSRRIVRAMGGELTGRNRTDKGSVFTIILPLMNPEGEK